MTLSDSVITTLNETSSQIHDKRNLSENDAQLIKDAFNHILARGDMYNVEEIELWLENEGSWTHRPTVIRVTNMSHYVLTKFQQSPKKFKVISNHDNCGCH
jgi:hypothetical protein